MKEEVAEGKPSILLLTPLVTKVSKLTEAAEHMAKRTNDDYSDQPRFELLDQNGRRLSLSSTDEEGLKVGMALHEKGKAMIKKGQFKEAVEILIEADRGFSKCSSTILSMVDNYGLLCLDISWAYFQLKDLSVLKDAVWRLAKARECLEKAYGKRMER